MARGSGRVFARGRGPGPKNIGVEYADGTKVVYTYRSYKELMADYVSANGFVQWDPQTREANGQDVFEFSIKTPGTDGALIRITVWPELQTETVLGVERGDFVAVDGKLNVGTYKAKSGEERSSIQINASRIAVLKGEVAEERAVVNAKEPAKDLF